jgi:uncharacterized membrane protein YraQ (UPF0718 family)
MMFTRIVYVLAITLLILSFYKDKKKTKIALKKAWKSFENMLPQFLSILIIIGVMLSVLTPETISKLIGEQSGSIGVIAASLIGSITLLPAFVAFPLAEALLRNGAGIMQIAAFVSTLMMVGVITIPIESSYFGRKAAILRNSLAFIYSFIVALVIGGVLN